jgi:hypothetical protein
MQTSQVHVEKVYLPTIGAPASEFVEQLNRWDDEAVSRGKGFLVTVEGERVGRYLVRARHFCLLDDCTNKEL